MSTTPDASLSFARIVAKTIHGLALVWTITCAGFAGLGLLHVGRISGNAETVGVLLGLGFWAVTWFVPVAAGELLALGILATSKPLPADRPTSQREWLFAGLATTLPALLLLGLLGLSFVSYASTPSRSTRPLGGLSDRR